jgi:NAD(P)-dependent dehydrogenase (short-subunit alcohol dehydrogenase family)
VTDQNGLQDRWALILGASSGMGAATALELARNGMHIFGVHLDLRSTLPNAQRVVAEVKEMGREAIFFNMNAADAKKRAQILDAVEERLKAEKEPSHVRVMLHSLAFGTLRSYVPADRKQAVSQAQMEMTLDVMAHSLVYWVQDMVYRGLLGPGSKVFAMTSSGSSRIWPAYGPVGCAKAALDYHVRHLAVELAARGIAVNAIRAGITDTPALRKIPGHEQMFAVASARHPSGRITTTEDVARAIAALSDERTAWMTGNIFGVDGGEDLSAG